VFWPIVPARCAGGSLPVLAGRAPNHTPAPPLAVRRRTADSAAWLLAARRTIACYLAHCGHPAPWEHAPARLDVHV
jgi:hypothetical protein